MPPRAATATWRSRLGGSVSRGLLAAQEQLYDLYVRLHIAAVLRALCWATVAFLAVVALMAVALAVLWCCFVGAVGASVAVRSYILSGISENQVLPVEWELAPMETERWRWQEWHAAVGQLPPSGTSERDRVLPTAGGGECGGGNTATCEEGGQQPGGRPADGSSCRALKDDPCGAAHVCEPASKRARNTPALLTHRSPADGWMHQATLNTMSTLQHRRWNAMLGHGTIRILGTVSLENTVGEGGQQQESGDVTQLLGIEEDLFLPTEKPLFNAMGSYAAVLQLVMLKEKLARPVTLSVHTKMLAATDDRKPVAPLHKLRTVFDTHQSTSILTGDLERSWIVSSLDGVVDGILYFPRTVLGFAWRLVEESGGPFPPLQEHEVSLTIPLYQQFHPPWILQRKLAAMNLTVYQRNDEDDSWANVDDCYRVGRGAPSRMPQVHLVRGSVAFSVKLEGLAYFLTEHPLLSSAIMTCFFFVSFACWTACIVIGLLSGGAYLWITLS